MAMCTARYIYRTAPRDGGLYLRLLIGAGSYVYFYLDGALEIGAAELSLPWRGSLSLLGISYALFALVYILGVL